MDINFIKEGQVMFSSEEKLPYTKKLLSENCPKAVILVIIFL